MLRFGMITATLSVTLMVACATKVTEDDCDDGYGDSKNVGEFLAPT